LVVGAALTLSATSAIAQKKQLVIVVKGLDNPFFEAINQGCQKWNRENASAQYSCFYTGPASTSDEAGEAQIVPGHAGQGRHGSDRDLALECAADRQRDQALQSESPGHDDRRRPPQGGCGIAQDLSRHRQLPDGFQGSASTSRRTKPNGGTVCLILGNVRQTTSCAAPPARATRCPGQKGLERLKGEGGWTEDRGLPGVHQ
jgi:ribose transport system substrate-binding protein